MVEFVSAWLQGLKQYDQDTYWHSVRTAAYFDQFMDYVGICKAKTKYIYASAALHDIGKLAVPLYILQKRGRLSHREYRSVKKHPEIAFAWMSLWREPDEFSGIPYLHHERWDGSGYPLGLRGIEIPYHVRLFSVIDVWEAMSVDRPYRMAIPQGAILGYIARFTSTLFDPEVVDAFLRWRKKTCGDCWTKLVYPTDQNSIELLYRVGRPTTPY
jgi:HD-GYP domain-containing protein (c-di-GMP phosphodiesterase class II)